MENLDLQEIRKKTGWDRQPVSRNCLKKRMALCSDVAEFKNSDRKESLRWGAGTAEN